MMAVNLIVSIILGIVIIILVTISIILMEIYNLYVAGSKKRSIMYKLPNSKQGFFGEIFQFPGLNEEGLKYVSEKMKLFPKWRAVFMTKLFPVVTIYHPDFVKIVLKTSEPKPTSPAMVYYFGKEWLGMGLLLSSGKKWSRSRRLLTPAFHYEILKPYMKINNDACSLLLNKMNTYAESGKSFEFMSNISQCTLDIILRCTMSYETDIQSSQGHPYLKAVNELAEIWTSRSMSPWYYPDSIFYLTPSGRKFKKLCEYVHSVTDDIIQKRHKMLQEKGKEALKGKGKYMDFLDMLLLSKNSVDEEDSAKMTDLDIRAEVDTFLFEGHDTTASAISWIIYSLAVHKNYQEKCQLEIDNLLGDRDNDIISWEDLGKFEYTTMCIKEAMRMHSPVPFVLRELSQPLEINGITLPESTIIEISIWSLHNNLAVWPEPDVFDPDRFSMENCKNRDPYAYCPFSAGPRNCIGQNFAMHEIKVIVCKILRRFNITIDETIAVRRTMKIVMRSENGIHLKIKKR